MRSVVMGETIRSFCRQHPGVAVILGGPGNRDVNPEIVRHYEYSNQTLVACSFEFDCSQAACINGVVILCGYESYNRAVRAFSKATSKLTSLGQVGPIVTGMGLKLEIRKPKYLTKILHRKRYEDAFNVIAGFTSGPWLVRLVHHKTSRVYHCVLVDANQRFILDSEERYPIRLTAETLSMCGGPSCPRLQVAQVFELCSTQ